MPKTVFKSFPDSNRDYPETINLTFLTTKDYYFRNRIRIKFVGENNSKNGKVSE